MGSINSISPTHVDNGIAYRQLSAQHYSRLALIAPYVAMGDRRAIICHDILLAKIAVLSSVLLSMSGSGLLSSDKNQTARDFARQAINKEFFMACFDKEVGGYK